MHIVGSSCSLAPVLIGALVSWAGGRLPPLDFAAIPRVLSYTVVLAGTAGLVTQEFAFRRLLVGQSGEAGLVIVAAAAVAAAIWHVLIPTGSTVWMTSVGAFLNATVLGALYVLSRSLFVTVTFHAVQLAGIAGLAYAGETVTGVAGLGQRFWIGHMIGVGVVGVGFGYYVFRQNGWIGVIPEEVRVSDAAGD